MNQTQIISANTQLRVPAQGSILSQSDVKQLYSLSRTRQWRLRKTGKLSYLDFGNGRVGYLPEHIDEYLRRCERRTITSGGDNQ